MTAASGGARQQAAKAGHTAKGNPSFFWTLLYENIHVFRPFFSKRNLISEHIALIADLY